MNTSGYIGVLIQLMDILVNTDIGYIYAYLEMNSDIGSNCVYVIKEIIQFTEIMPNLSFIFRT